jgi:hypothetical protein
MPFQQSGFQSAAAKARLRSRLAAGGRNWIERLFRPPKGVPLLAETPWQRGKRETHELANGRAILFTVICAPIFAVGGTLVLSGLPWPLRILVAALLAFGAAIAATLAISAYFALRAP